MSENSKHVSLQWNNKDIISKLDHWDIIAGDFGETTGVTSDQIKNNREAIDYADDILEEALDTYSDQIMEYINDKIWDYMMEYKGEILENFEDLLK